MTKTNWERWAATTGYLVLALGLAAASFERGAPPADASGAESLAYFVTYRRELLAQSLLFVLSSGVYLWFFGSLRSFLQRAEGGDGRVSMIVFGAGVVWAGLQMVFQSGQIAVAMGGSDLTPALAVLLGDLTYALSVVAYVPLAIMLTGVAAVSLRYGAFPAWLGWLSALNAAANLLMSSGIVAESGLLVPGGVLTYVLYALMPLWLASVTTVMVRRLGRPAGNHSIAARSDVQT